MKFEIDHNSDESKYIQLHDRIVTMIASGKLSEGDILPSVREMAEILEINFHTVNKAYALLRDEGYVFMDPGAGTVVQLSFNKRESRSELDRDIKLLVAKAKCRNIDIDELHRMLDANYGKLTKKMNK
ncbi:MAG: GntR family transcriptional regulator [Lachnospiraceae bacterium]|nr:GntR family transcriptional regulator [Lachnospiraceae bacterium]